MRLQCATIAVVGLLSASCSHQPPAYESAYTPPTTTSWTQPSRPPLPTPQASFIEEFDRANSTLGLGPDWDLRGAMAPGDYSPPPATDGFIKDGAFTYAGSSTVYAMRQFKAPVRTIGTVGSFTKSGRGPETAMVMLFTPDDRILVNVVNFSANRRSWQLGVRDQAGAIKYRAKRAITPPLEFDRPYVFEMAASEDTIAVRVGDYVESVHVPQAAELVGNLAVWGEHNPGAISAGDVFSFDTVWSRVDGRPARPVPLPPGTSP